MRWIVVEYERVDVRGIQDKDPTFMPGSPERAEVVTADIEMEAIMAVAQSEGFFRALPLPDGTPVHVVLKVDED